MPSNQPPLQIRSPFDREGEEPVVAQGFVQTRGIIWVLKWTAATAVLIYSTSVLVEFAYSLAAEHMLARAARAAVLEATLPRATVHSVEQTARRRLGDSITSHGGLKLALLQNGAWVSKKLQPRGGDQLSVALSIPAQALMPNWLRTLTLWRGSTTIQARAERTIPGRVLYAQ